VSESFGDKELILGRDFMRANRVVVDHGTDKITIRKQIKFNNGSVKAAAIEVNCVVAQNTSIKEKSEQIVKVHVTVSHAGKDVLFTPKASGAGIYWSHSLCRVDQNGDIAVTAINLNGKPVETKSGTYVGYVSLLKSKLDAFQWSPNDTGRTVLIKHNINTGSAAPVKKKQFKIAQAVQSVMDETIEDLQKQKFIEPSESPWCSPVMIVRQTQRDGKTKYRFISDNRGLNNVTVKDSFPLNRSVRLYGWCDVF
jgi:hypothetical protein